jgi:hypothetical protein
MRWKCKKLPVYKAFHEGCAARSRWQMASMQKYRVQAYSGKDDLARSWPAFCFVVGRPLYRVPPCGAEQGLASINRCDAQLEFLNGFDHANISGRVVSKVVRRTLIIQFATM